MSHALLKEPFTSAVNLVHIINHGRSTNAPTVTVFDQSTFTQIIPASVVANSPSQVQVTLSAPAAIYGTVE